MYDDEDWRGGFRFRLPCLYGIPSKLLFSVVIVVLSWKLGRLIRSMKIRLEVLEAILLDHPPRV